MPTLQIQSFVTAVSLTADATRIDFTFVSGEKQSIRLTPQQFAAAAAALQMAKTAYYSWNDAGTSQWISSAEDTPGI